MALPISQIVNVSISVSATPLSRAGFGTLMCVTAETGVLTTTERTREYGSIAEVADDWGTAAEVYLAASYYFSQSPQPTSFMVGFRDSTETITEALTEITDESNAYYGFMFTSEVRDLVVINTEDAVEAGAAFAEANTKVFFNTTNDSNTLVSTATSDIGYVLQQKSLRRTITTYSSTSTEYPSASVAGRAFTVQFTAGSPVITLKFKQLPGITVEDLKTSQKNAMSAKNVNTYLKYSTVSMYAEGVMASGAFFDEVHGIDWLQNAIQTNVFNYLYQKSTKVPYTDVGIQGLKQYVTSAMEEAVTCGLVAPGTTSEGVYLSEGYLVETVAASDVSAADKASRTYTGLSFTALGAGAIHFVTIAGTFES